MNKAELNLLQNLSNARDALDLGIKETTAAESVFYAPAQPAAKASARTHLSSTLRFLAAAKVTPSSKCKLENAQPILDNPFYMFAMARYHLGKLLLLENKVDEAASEFEAALNVFPFIPKVVLGLANARRVLASDEGMLKDAEVLFERAIREAEELKGRVEEEKERVLREKDEEQDGEDEEEEEEDEEEEVNWTEHETVTLEINAGLIDASNALILLLIQLDRASEAEPLLLTLKYKYRLSSNVLSYTLPRKGPWRPDIPFVKAIDNALPPSALTYLQTAFSRTSPFWTEHFYCPDTPYFSYSHALSAAKQNPRSAMDQLITYVHALVTPLFPDVARAQSAEWWTHSRTHCSGHQMHFDSAHEGKAKVSEVEEEGGGVGRKRKRVVVGPVHPIVSCVIYLSEGVGGPTMVTNQRLRDPLADKGWMVESAVNRLVVFDGSVLHGVIPGKGFHSNSEARRTSFMIAFWDHVDIKSSLQNIPGSARPFPEENSSVYTWPALHKLKSPNSWPGQIPKNLKHVIPTPLDRVWQSVPDSESIASVQTIEEVLEEHLEFHYSKSELGLPNYNLVFQGF